VTFFKFVAGSIMITIMKVYTAEYPVAYTNARCLKKNCPRLMTLWQHLVAYLQWKFLTSLLYTMPA